MADIIVKNISKTLGNRKVINQLTYNFENEFYILKGLNGSGKTTLLNLIVGYIKPDSGSIEVNGSIFYSFQEETLFHNLSVLQNLMIFISAQKNRSKKNLEDEVHDALRELKIEHLLNRKVNSLSGGERQKIELVKLVLLQPEIILMDEPTARLDQDAKEEFWNLVQSLCDGKLLIIITHDDIKLQNPSWKSLKLQNGILENEL